VTNKVDIVLPPKPERSEIKAPESLKDYAQIINYYEHLVQEWEQWSRAIEQQIEK